MKRIKEAAIGRAKVNIANAQIRYKRNYDKRFGNKEDFKVGDRVLLENQINKNRKGSKGVDRFLGPYKIIEISDDNNNIIIIIIVYSRFCYNDNYMKHTK